MGRASQRTQAVQLATRIAACAALGACLVTSAPAHADTLHSVVREALETNPELEAIRFNRKAIDHELRAARGLGLPTLDAKAEAGTHRDSLKTNLAIENSDSWHGHRDLSLIMSQRIFDGFEREHEVDRQKSRVESARWRVNDTANSIALRAVQAYFEVQRATSVLAAADDNLTALRRLNNRVAARVNGGYGDGAEASEAGSRVAQAHALVTEAKARLADARALFRSVVGRDPGPLSGASIPERALPNSISEAVRVAREAAPSVIATQYDTDAAEEAVGSAYSRLYPRLNVEVSSYYGKGIDEANDRDIDMRAMLVVRWSLYNGGINRARISEASERANEARSIADNTRRIVERETRVSWNAMVSAGERMPSLSRRLALLRQTRTTYTDQFATGSRRLLDLLDAQNEVFIADSALRTEEFIRQYNSFRVLAAMGQLVWAMGLSLPEEATQPHQQWVFDGWLTSVSD